VAFKHMPATAHAARAGTQEVHRHGLTRAPHARVPLAASSSCWRDEELDEETRRRFWTRRASRSSAAPAVVDSWICRGSRRFLELRPEHVGPRRARPVGLDRVRADAGPARRPLDCGCRRAPSQPRSGAVRQILRIPDRSTALTHTPSGTQIVVTAAASDGCVRSPSETTARASPASPCPGSSSRSSPPTTPGVRLGLAIASELAERWTAR